MFAIAPKGRLAVLLAALTGFGLAAVPSTTGAVDAQASFNDWRLFVETDGPVKTCYLVGEPNDSDPRSARRGDIFLSVAHRPAQGVRNEVSVRIGYPFSATSSPFARIGSDEFAFFTGVQAQNGADEWAWMTALDQQPRLVDAMKRGSELVFKGTSARGTLTTDRYSLRGFTKAMKALDAACPAP